MTRESFSSEIGDVHERRGDRPSFTDEFEGIPEHLLDRDHPPRVLDAGRRGRRLMLGVIFSCAALIAGGWALWYWSEPIGAWIAGLGRQTEPEAPAEPAPAPEPATVEPEPEPEPAGPEKVFGIRGAPNDDASMPVESQAPVPGPEMPVEPQTAPVEPALPVEPQTPASVSSKIQSTATNVRGKVSNAAVEKRLGPVDAALPSCWAAALEAGASAAVELELSLKIRWSGRANAIAVSGGSDALQQCVRASVPGGGWPKPSDGGDAKVVRRWMLGG